MKDWRIEECNHQSFYNVLQACKLCSFQVESGFVYPESGGSHHGGSREAQHQGKTNDSMGSMGGKSGDELIVL